MHPFDEWLLERLVAVGALCLGDTAPDVAAALSLYQESEGLAKTAFADDATVNMLRRQYSQNPKSSLIIFRAAPCRVGSRYAEKGFWLQ